MCHVSCRTNTSVSHLQAGTVASHLLQIQPTFKADLLDGVEKFKVMVTTFVQEYNEK